MEGPVRADRPVSLYIEWYLFCSLSARAVVLISVYRGSSRYFFLLVLLIISNILLINEKNDKLDWLCQVANLLLSCTHGLICMAYLCASRESQDCNQCCLYVQYVGGHVFSQWAQWFSYWNNEMHRRTTQTLPHRMKCVRSLLAQVTRRMQF